HPRPAAGPDGSDSPVGLHHRRKSRHRQAPLVAEAAGKSRGLQEQPEHQRQRAQSLDRRLRPRGRGASAGETAGQTGRPERGRDHGQCFAFSGAQSGAEERRGHDRRADAYRPRAAHRWRAREGHCSASAEDFRIDPAGAEPWQLRRTAGLFERRHHRALCQTLLGRGEDFVLKPMPKPDA
nr:hypothetical protein [Tanacetum cinerariifolium]